MKSERKPTKVWSTYSPTSSFSLCPRKYPQFEEHALVHDMDVAGYSKNGSKCKFCYVQQWATQSVIGIPLRLMPNYIYV